MDNLKMIIAKNITFLRTNNKMTQLQLAEQLNYTDKAISKWERAESLPDIIILKEISDLFGVNIDYLLEDEHVDNINSNSRIRFFSIISFISIFFVWFISTSLFVTLKSTKINHSWLSFLYSVPVCLILWFIFNSIWFSKHINYIIISLFMWSIIVCTHITLILCNYNIWTLYLIGVPAQIIILLWSNIKKN